MRPAVAGETDLGDPVHATAVHNTATGYADAFVDDYETGMDVQPEPACSSRPDGHPRPSQTTARPPNSTAPSGQTPAVQIVIDRLRDCVDRLAGDLCKAEASLAVAMQTERKLYALEQEKYW